MTPSRRSVRSTLLALAALLLGLAAWYMAPATRTERALLCDAARDPNAYTGNWFYTLHEGPDGWLLRNDDLQESFELDARTLVYLARFNQVLRAEGVTLIVVALPTRGTALPETIPDYNPETALRSYARANAALEAAGILAPNLAPLAHGADFFFKRDHHWTPEGARRGARAVARTVREESAYRALEPHRYRTERVGTETQLGSYGEAVERICGASVPPERVPLYRTEREGEGADTGLFGETSAPPVVLLGTSNSAREELNFAGFLEQETGLEVLNASAIGGGPTVALGSYLRSETFHAAPPRFAVWEFTSLFDVPTDPVFYRQLIPSVAGACPPEESMAHVTRKVTGGKVPLLRSLGSAEPGFLYLEASDLSLVSFGVVVSYRDGRAETVEIVRPTALPNDGRFFLELTGIPTKVTLRVPEGTTGKVQARLCPSPSAS